MIQLERPRSCFVFIEIFATNLFSICSWLQRLQINVSYGTSKKLVNFMLQPSLHSGDPLQLTIVISH